ncbi:MAG: NitT/TauT family transport system permease protein [Pseudonocardiales bacterium]|uniref:ABC transporter permease n=1 Tax=Pseudonocardia sp. Cha107L01 TaxID=3457576 RepID=UPI0028C77BE2|nr:NitT/TauT family transport system permease protein [Pseudonocardiales bacterium]MDT7586416.1 NitT/TauT family transport system permease protein [Pseudonocardiales bacterium]MDT7624581.1 NitT/TauT family transport system permease protein [Pseudonocardiales bacterium]MDT7635989.1 NitT/TauT family transport system permease protein [Pseudonocardiales bacterium]MDT7675189.1 NitT/TauT family transport system permease protein [Pseudonocardiales bacterium]
MATTTELRPEPVREAGRRVSTRLLAGRLLRPVGWLLRRGTAIVAFLLAWEFVPRSGLVDRVFLPPLHTVLGAWLALAGNGQLEQHLGASLLRSVTGLALAVLIAVPLGVLVGWYRPVAEALNPLLEIFRNTAPLALLPVFVLLLGLGETSKIALVLFASLWPILLNTVSAVRTVDPLLVRSARSLGLSSLSLFWKVVLPSALPTLFTGVRLAVASSIMVLVAAEMMGAKAGLGYLINSAQFNFQIPQMYAGILTISLLGLGLNQLLVTLERRFSRWRAPVSG